MLHIILRCTDLSIRPEALKPKAGSTPAPEYTLTESGVPRFSRSKQDVQMLTI
jgi:hypothetical protein